MQEHISKTELALPMKTSRASLDRMFDPSNPSLFPRPVTEAGNIQRLRFATSNGVTTNAAMRPKQVREHCALDAESQGYLEQAMERLLLQNKCPTPRSPPHSGAHHTPVVTFRFMKYSTPFFTPSLSKSSSEP